MSIVITNKNDRKNDAFKLMVLTGKTIKQFMMQWGAIWVHDLIDYTAPRGARDSKQSWPDQKKAGENRVEMDIRKVFKGLESFEKRLAYDRIISSHPQLRAYILNAFRSGAIGELNTILARIKSPLRLITQPSEDLHDQLRTSRGRVPKRPALRYFITGDTRSIERYIDLKKRNVGKLKSGWMTAALELGSKDIPKWVSRHHEPGGCSINLSGPRYQIKVWNSASGTKDQDPNKILIPAANIIRRKIAQSVAAISRH